MDIGPNRRRAAAARAVVAALLTAALGACADQSSPAPVYIRNAGSGPPASPFAPQPAPPRLVVIVKQGQTLNALAHFYHVRPSQIVAANDLKPPYELRAGMRLIVPAGDAPPAAVASAVRPAPIVPPAAVAPTPLPPPKSESPAPVARAAAPPAVPPDASNAPAAADANVIPLDGAVPKQNAAAAGVPPVLPPRNAAAALPLPGEASIDWGSADAARGAAGGRFPWPVRGRILASYGSTAGGSRNEGINIGAPRGTPVHAIDTGTVAYVGNEVKGFGNLVLIKHANGWISAYAHLDQPDVKVGDKIASGEVVGRVGDSGGVGEPQLHFELRRGKKPVDPKEFLAPAPSAGRAGQNQAG